MVEHNQSTYNGGQYNNVYKFNGKELDDATVMYYYGARYYDPRISIFVSVDPLAEQTMEPYLYTGNNPIMFTDPTGMAPEDIVINFYSFSVGRYIEYARIKSDKYEMNVNLSLPYPSFIVSQAPDLSQQRTYGKQRGADGMFPFDRITKALGDPDAIALSTGFDVALGYGIGGSTSIALMMNGKDKGKAGLYWTSNSLEGIEASVNMQLSVMYSDIPKDEFRLNTLEGYGEGFQGGFSFIGGSKFESYSGEYQKTGGFFSKSVSKKDRKLYHGESFGVGLGPEDLSVSDSIFSGDTKYMGEITNQIKER